MLSLRQKFKDATTSAHEDRQKILNQFLLLAAEENDTGLCRDLLIASANPNTHIDNKTALMIAAQKDNTDLIKILLSFGASTEIICDSDGNTALFAALLSKSKKAADLLVDAGADINKARSNSETALHFTARLGDLDLMQKILLRASSDTINQQTQNYRYTALHLAIHNGHKSLADCLIRAGAFIDLKDSREETPLAATIRLDQTEICHSLLQAGADPDMLFGRDNEVPLHKAMAMKRRAIFALLLRYGADPLLTDSAARNALCIAAREGDQAIFMTLMQHMSQNGFTKQDYAYALYDACFYRHGTIVLDLLTKQKVDPNIRTAFNKCALEVTVETNQLEITAYLLNAGAKADTRDAHGQKMIDIARRKGFSEMVQLLSTAPRPQ